MSDRPITERQLCILTALSNGEPATPVNIAHRIGIRKGPRRLGTVWSGYQSPAQYVIGSLTGLRNRNYVRVGRRLDGRSGTAYTITEAGRASLARFANPETKR